MGKSRGAALGRYLGLRGPGLFIIVPIVDSLSRFVDQRVSVASVSAESTLTRDTVPVNVDAIVFWMVWNAEKSILEVQDFTQAIMLSAQTALRESIGRHDLHQMVAEREMLGRELQRILDEKTNAVGHHRAIGGNPRRADPVGAAGCHVAAGAGGARAAGAHHSGAGGNRYRRQFRQGRATYQDNPVALHLRAMNMLYEAIKERGSMVIVPSSAVETMGLGGMLATAALSGKTPQ